MKLILSDRRFTMTDNLYQNKNIMDMIYQLRQEKIESALSPVVKNLDTSNDNL